VINVLCEHVLINAYVDEQRPILVPLVDEVARDFELDCAEPTAPPIPSMRPDGCPAEESVLQEYLSPLDRLGQPSSVRTEVRQSKV
jgi:hypothetical protein